MANSTETALHNEFVGTKLTNIGGVQIMTLNLNQIPSLNVAKTPAWLVLARVVITNFDSDAQNFQVELRLAGGGSGTFDTVTARIPGGGPFALAISLQHAFVFKDRSDFIVELWCSGFNGTASEASIIGLNLADVHP